MKQTKANASRARRLNDWLLTYETDDTAEGCLTDLLTDARHWCDRYGQSYAVIDRRAYQHYLAELATSFR